MPLNIPKLVQGAVKLIESNVGSARVLAAHYKIIGQNQYGPIFSTTPVTAEAMMDLKSELVIGTDNAEKVSSAIFYFFEPYMVREREKFIVNGITYTVIKVGGLVDPTTQLPYNPTVWTRGSY